ncbi:hypothetical protein GQ600_27822 [Phytophthora cactorum]|nr:hypothetical protein GQ600_27822 [Phytophthora cactorum]
MLRMDYGKDIGMSAFIVGDNCSVNKRLAGLLHIPLVGSFWKILPRFGQRSGADDQATKPELSCKVAETRWSSTFMMIDSYFKLLEFVKDDADLGTRSQRALRIAA